MTPAFPLPIEPRIATARLSLRLLQASDLPDLMQVNGDEVVTRFLPYKTWSSPADAQAWLERMEAGRIAGTWLQFVIVLQSTQRVIGTCLVFHLDEPSARAEVGYVLARAHWGAGCMQEAMAGVTAFAFEQMGLRRLEAEIDPRNTASAKLLQRLGFVKEGHLRERWFGKGELTDSALYGLLRADWLAGPKLAK